jgi:hypothetical protein
MPKPNPTALIHEAYLRLIDVSVETVHRDWRLARSWLLRLLRGGNPDEA